MSTLRFYFFSFHILTMPSLSFDLPFSLAKFERHSQSCSMVYPFVLSLYDNCHALSVMASVFPAVGSHVALCLSKHCFNSSSCGLFLSWKASISSHISNQASNLSCSSTFDPLTTLVWLIDPSSHVNKSFSLPLSLRT